MFGQGKVKSIKDINDMITVLFEALAEDRIRRQEQESKSKVHETAISELRTTIEAPRLLTE
jgi:hypothetical protein